MQHLREFGGMAKDLLGWIKPYASQNMPMAEEENEAEEMARETTNANQEMQGEAALRWL